MTRATAYLLAVLLPVLLSSCKPVPDATGGRLVLEEHIQLSRGDTRDTAERTISAKNPATFVVMAEEDEVSSRLTLTVNSAPGTPPSTVEVESPITQRGIQVATINAPADSTLTMTVGTNQYTARADKITLRVLQFDTTNSATANRLAALRKWTDATLAGGKQGDERRARAKLMDEVITHFESAEGDARLAAWAHTVKSELSASPEVSWKESAAAARKAADGFAKLGAKRQSDRAWYSVAEALLQIMVEPNAVQPSAKDSGEEAKQILLRLRTPESALSGLDRARTVMNLGYYYYQLEDMDNADKYMAEGAREYREQGSWTGELTALANLGTIASERGNFEQSVRYHEPIMARIKEVPSPYLRSLYLYNAASADANSGRTERALERFREGLELARESKSAANEARMLYGLGHVYWRLGDTAQAGSFYAASLDIRRTIEDNVGLITSLRMGGALARDAGDFDRAIALHREGESLAPTARMRRYLKHELARDFAAKGDIPRALQLARESLVRDGSDHFRRNETQLVLAELLVARDLRPGTLIEAEQLANDSLSNALKNADIPLEAYARRVRAQLFAERGEYAEARHEYEAAIQLIYEYGSASTNPELQAATLANEQAAFRGYVDLLMRDVAKTATGKRRAATPDEQKALQTVEYARALNFRPSQDARLGTKTRQRIDELLTRMAEKRVRIASIVDRGAPAEELSQLQLDTAGFRAEVDELRLEALGTEHVALTRAGKLPTLQPDVTQLSYALGRKHVYLWVRDAKGISTLALSETPSQIERRVDALFRKTTPQPELDKQLAALSRVLLPAGAVEPGSTVLEVIADGKLANLPFAALTSPNEASRRLIETHAVRMMASMATPRPAATSPQRSLSFVAVAGGTGTTRQLGRVFPSLSSTRAEASAIAGLFTVNEGSARVKVLGAADGNAAELKKLWTDGTHVLHFATHGLANVRQPMASLLLLPATLPDGGATYLTAGQVQDWQGDIGLVFLSACETAVGPAKFADGIPGLQRAFLRAGARGVIATLWPIDDVTARDFSVDFYRRYLTNRAADLALRDTQRAWLADKAASPADALRRRMTALAHVYYTQ
jgi:CHAT domain-containing protein